ncbi:MAG: DUF992 domain-containing protein [Pseudomonadota bacterium]
MLVRAFAILTILTFVATAAVTNAAANASVRVGLLSCDLDGGIGLIVGSRKTMTCFFNGNAAPGETYLGSTTKIGLDAGATAEGKLTWAVFAPTSRMEPGALEGRYYGVGAEATFGVGLGANVLVGGFDKSINLIPVSLQGQLGANVAGGLEYVRLRWQKSAGVFKN